MMMSLSGRHGEDVGDAASLTSSMRPRSCPMLSGRLTSLLLLALKTRRGKPDRQAGSEPSWFRLQTQTISYNMSLHFKGVSVCEVRIFKQKSILTP